MSDGTASAAPQAARRADLASGTVCLRCVQRVVVEGDPEWGPAFHADTGKERGQDGHLVAPIEAVIARAIEVARRAGERS